MPPRATFILACAGAQAIFAGANHNLPLDRPHTLRNAEPLLLERVMARQILSQEPMSSIFPRPCISGADSSSICNAPRRPLYADSSRNLQLSISPMLGLEYRFRDEHVNAFEGGVLAAGASGPVSFHLDARMFAELHENPFHASYDGEFVERQDEASSGAVAYSSYSRYRADLSYDMAWGRLSAGRDAAHWGPGLYENLVFNQQAVPFHQLTLTARLGPLRVQTLYGKLTASDPGAFPKDSVGHSVYAHRYEFAAGKDWTVGISEQLFLYDREEPFAFLPMIPLYIMKAYANEDRGNGNIAADLAWRVHPRARVYTEFLIDDLQSPASLFDDFWANKWAWMAGFHVAAPWPSGGADCGLAGEYSRVEPWVYTHYRPRTAQAANQGLPLGNPHGPNSQSLILKPYLAWDPGWYAAVPAGLSWKGRDPGSAISDSMDEDSDARKAFIRGIGTPDWHVSPVAGFRLRAYSAFVQASFGEDPGLTFRAAASY